METLDHLLHCLDLHYHCLLGVGWLGLAQLAEHAGLPFSLIPLEVELFDQGDDLWIFVGHQVGVRVEHPGHGGGLVGDEVHFVQSVDFSQREDEEVLGAAPVGHFHEFVVEDDILSQGEGFGGKEERVE